MARREWQNPSILERAGAAGPEWYIRYRIKVLDIVDGKPKIRRVEKVAVAWVVRQSDKEAGRTRERADYARGEPAGLHRAVPDTISAGAEDVHREPRRRLVFPDLPRRRTSSTSTPTLSRRSRTCDCARSAHSKSSNCSKLMEQKGLSRNTRKTTKGILKSIFGCAKRWKYIDTPTSPVKDASVGGGPRIARTKTRADAGRCR